MDLIATNANRIRDLPSFEQDLFRKWLINQAVPTLADDKGHRLPDNEQDGYYGEQETKLPSFQTRR